MFSCASFYFSSSSGLLILLDSNNLVLVFPNERKSDYITSNKPTELNINETNRADCLFFSQIVLFEGSFFLARIINSTKKKKCPPIRHLTNGKMNVYVCLHSRLIMIAGKTNKKWKMISTTIDWHVYLDSNSWCSTIFHSGSMLLLRDRKNILGLVGKSHSIWICLDNYALSWKESIFCLSTENPVSFVPRITTADVRLCYWLLAIAQYLFP